jgi:hypothetical protein
MKKQNLEMLQLLESIEVMLQNGNSIHPDSVIRGAIRIAIGMDQYGMPDGLDTPEKHDQYLKDIGLMKQTAVEWLEDEINRRGPKEDNPPQWLKDLYEQAKEMEKEQIGKAFLNGRIKEIGQGVLFDLQPLTETFNDYYNETFKSE